VELRHPRPADLTVGRAAIRVALAAAAVLVVVVALGRQEAASRCDDALRATVGIALGAPVALDADAAADVVLADCRGGGPPARAALALVRAGAQDPAARLAEEAVRRDPRDVQAWIALGRVLDAAGNEAGARRARDEVRRLSPSVG
jgi:Flp pilus assembly protein TadD